MTTLFGIAFLLAILALIEGICICTKRKLHTQKQPASCYVLLSALELRPDWKAELNHLFSDLQWFPMWNIFGISENFNGMSFSIEK